MPAFRRPRGWVRPLLWAALVAVAVGYLLIGTIRISAGNWTGRHTGADAIWRSYLAFIAELGAPSAILIAITVAAALTLVCSGWALWLALTLHDRDETSADNEA